MTTNNDNATAPPVPLYDTKAVAYFLDVSPWWLGEQVRLGILTPTVHVGRMMRFDHADVLVQLDRARAEGRA